MQGTCPRADGAEIPVLFLDDTLVAVSKPPGLLVHRTRLAEAEAFLLQRLRDQLGRRLFAVHRLDRPTSGVMLFALTQAAAKHLSRQFEAQRVAKQYLAVVRGWPDAEGCIDYALADAEASAAGQRALRPARTSYRRLATVDVPVAVGRYPTSRYALLRVQPHTGRRHQIRRHLAHIRHPLIGDTTHGEGRHNRYFRERFGVERLLLHACEIGFEHPGGGHMAVSAPLDTDWGRVLDGLGWAETAGLVR
jgi:tRNA pseudouridine65 synthase